MGQTDNINSISIFDTNGRKVLDVQEYTGSISLADLGVGVYMVNIQFSDSDSVRLEQIVVVK